VAPWFGKRGVAKIMEAHIIIYNIIVGDEQENNYYCSFGLE
jgi:hypothetical protein